MNAFSLERLAQKLNDPDLGETLLPDGSGVLLDIDGHQVLSFSKTAVFLVQQIRAGIPTTEALAEKLANKFSVDIDTAQADTATFLADLTKALISKE